MGEKIPDFRREGVDLLSQSETVEVRLVDLRAEPFGVCVEFFNDQYHSGLPLRDLQEKIGVSYQTLSKILREESNSIPSNHTIKKITRSFGWSEGDLRCKFLLDKAKAEREQRKNAGLIFYYVE